eukprot:2467649-Rhodomonas_salina.1
MPVSASGVLLHAAAVCMPASASDHYDDDGQFWQAAQLPPGRRRHGFASTGRQLGPPGRALRLRVTVRLALACPESPPALVMTLPGPSVTGTVTIRTDG